MPASRRPAPIALASEAIDWLHMLLSTSLNDEILDLDTLLTALQSLKRDICEDRRPAADNEHTSLRRKAIDTAVALAPQLLRLDGDNTVIAAEYIEIAKGIIAGPNLSTTEAIKTYNNQLADIESYKSLKANLIPCLDSASTPDALHAGYCRALFDASIIHSTEESEIPASVQSPLQSLGNIKRGRPRRAPPCQRERMSYLCFDELADLASRKACVDHQKLAHAAAPLLLLRLAIPIRIYIADQPLRGRRPQPLSELEELLYCFEAIRKLDLNPEALTADPIADGRTGGKLHVHFLYPLLAKAIAEAGDRWSGTEEVFRPLQTLLESIAPTAR